MSRTVPLGIAAIALSALTAAAQAPASATGRVTGVVMTLEPSPSAVRRAVVTLKGPGAVSLTEISSDDGRYDFRTVPPGRYTLTASRAGFLPGTFGARRTGQPGTPLSVGPGETIVDTRVLLTRGAAISGTVRDSKGRPVPNVEVLVRPTGSDIEASFPIQTLDSIVTDDRGTYRAYGLAPGSYVVAALPRLTFGSVELHAMTPAEIDAALRSLQTAQKPGSAPAAADTRSSARQMYVPVFHPQATSQADAAAVTVGAGADIGSIDITLTLVSSVSLEGQIVHPNGAVPTGTQVIISGAGSRMPIHFAFAPVLTARPGPDGRFKYTNMAPGAYTLTARTQDRSLFAIAQITAGGDDVRGVTLGLQPALTFSGSVRVDASSSTPPRITGFPIALQPPGGRGGGVAVANSTYLGLRPSASGAVADDGTFAIGGVLPGIYGVTLTPPAGLRLRSVMLDGRDVLDEVMTIDRSASGAVVTLTDRQTELAGTLHTPAGTPATDYDVLVFSADPRHWFGGSRRTKTARAGSDGRYGIRDLPAGDYLVAALGDYEPAQLGDPKFLERVARSAIKVTVAEGGTARLDLKIAK